MKRLDPADERQISWDFYAYAILAAFALLQLLRWGLFPIFLDIYYHLTVVSGFAKAGGYVTSAFWEYAPVGRVHLYPPLFHVLMLFAYKIGLSKLFIARFFSCLIYPAFLFVSWLLVKKIFNSRLAFFVILAASSCFGLYISVINLIPFSLGLLLGMLVLLCIEKKKALASGMILGLIFYTHSQAPWLVLLWVALYGLFNRQNFKICLKAIGLGLFLAMPILFHQFYNRHYFKFINVMENFFLDINLLVYALAGLGLFIALKRKGEYRIFLCIVLGLLPLFFTHKLRYFSGIGLFGFVFLAGLGLDYIFQKVSRGADMLKQSLILVSIALAFYIFSPTLYIDRTAKTLRLGFFDTTLANTLKGTERKFRSMELSIYYPKYEDEVVRIVEENSARDDIIWSDLNYFAGLISLFSGRATSTAMLSEVKPYTDFDPVKAARLIILFKEINGSVSPRFMNIIKDYGLRKIQETEIAFVYINPGTNAKEKIPKALIPDWALFSIFFIYLGLVIYCWRRG